MMKPAAMALQTTASSSRSESESESESDRGSTEASLMPEVEREGTHP